MLLLVQSEQLLRADEHELQVVVSSLKNYPAGHKDYTKKLNEQIKI